MTQTFRLIGGTARYAIPPAPHRGEGFSRGIPAEWLSSLRYRGVPGSSSVRGADRTKFSIFNVRAHPGSGYGRRCVQYRQGHTVVTSRFPGVPIPANNGIPPPSPPPTPELGLPGTRLQVGTLGYRLVQVTDQIERLFRQIVKFARQDLVEPVDRILQANVLAG